MYNKSVSPADVAEYIVRCTSPNEVGVCKQCPYHGTSTKDVDCATLLAMDAAELILAACGK